MRSLFYFWQCICGLSKPCVRVRSGLCVAAPRFSTLHLIGKESVEYLAPSTYPSFSQSRVSYCLPIAGASAAHSYSLLHLKKLWRPKHLKMGEKSDLACICRWIYAICAFWNRMQTKNAAILQNSHSSEFCSEVLLPNDGSRNASARGKWGINLSESNMHKCIALVGTACKNGGNYTQLHQKCVHYWCSNVGKWI